MPVHAALDGVGIDRRDASQPLIVDADVAALRGPRHGSDIASASLLACLGVRGRAGGGLPVRNIVPAGSGKQQETTIHQPPHGWKIARLFSRLEARVFRPAVAMFTSNDAVLPFPLRASLNRVDAQLDELSYQAFPQAKAS